MKKHRKHNYLYGPVATEFYNSPVGTWKSVKPVINHEECTLCKQCMQYCPTGVITKNSSIESKIYIDLEYCKGCGICSNICPNKCILMVKNE